jgi:chitinase
LTVTPTTTTPPTASPAPSSPGSRRVVAYYPIWVPNAGYTPSAIDFHTVTTVAHFSVLPAGDGNVAIPDWGPFPDPGLIATAHAAGAKVVLVVGTGNDASVPAAFSKMAASAATRQRFAQRLLTLLNTNGYDGVDLDWEFPASAADRTNLSALVGELRTALGSSRTLSVVTPANDWNGQWFDLGALARIVDWFGVLTYDLSGADWSSYVDHNAALYPGRSGELSLDSSLQYYLSRGVPRSKIYPGLPFFGQRFDAATSIHQAQTPPSKGASPDYKEIAALAGNGWTAMRDAKAQVPYLVRTGGAGVISYDDATSIAAKCSYVKTQALGGTIVWHLGKDLLNGRQPLLQAAGACR